MALIQSTMTHSTKRNYIKLMFLVISFVMVVFLGWLATFYTHLGFDWRYPPFFNGMIDCFSCPAFCLVLCSIASAGFSVCFSALFGLEITILCNAILFGLAVLGMGFLDRLFALFSLCPFLILLSQANLTEPRQAIFRSVTLTKVAERLRIVS